MSTPTIHSDAEKQETIPTTKTLESLHQKEDVKNNDSHGEIVRTDNDHHGSTIHALIHVLPNSNDENDNTFFPPSNLPMITTTAASPEQQVLLLTDFPEGGFGWFVVLASFVIYFWIFGITTTFGVYQAHFFRSGAFNNATETEISWIGSIASGVVFLPGPFINSLIRFFGLYTLVIIGMLSCSFGFILASFGTQLWHLYLTQGVMFGLGGGLVFLSTISITSQYFEKRRGFANGIVVSGSGIGGLILAPLTNALISKLSLQWSQRIIGLSMLVCLAAIFPLIRPRVQVVKTNTGPPVVDWTLFKVKGFVWLWLFSFIMPFGE